MIQKAAVGVGISGNEGLQVTWVKNIIEDYVQQCSDDFDTYRYFLICRPPTVPTFLSPSSVSCPACCLFTVPGTTPGSARYTSSELAATVHLSQSINAKCSDWLMEPCWTFIREIIHLEVRTVCKWADIRLDNQDFSVENVTFSF